MPNSFNKFGGFGYPYRPSYYGIIIRASFNPSTIPAFIILLIWFYIFNKNFIILYFGCFILSYRVSQGFLIFLIYILCVIGDILYRLSPKLNKINLNSKDLILNFLNEALLFYNIFIFYYLFLLLIQLYQFFIKLECFLYFIFI